MDLLAIELEFFQREIQVFVKIETQQKGGSAACVISLPQVDILLGI